MKTLCFGIFGLLLVVRAQCAKIDNRGSYVDYWRREKIHREEDESIVLTKSIRIPPPSHHKGKDVTTGLIQDGYVPADCTDIQKHSIKNSHKRPTSGVYRIYPAVGKGYKAYCDFITDGGGWTVFQKRYDGSVDFYRTWKEYQDGFGRLNGEHWLGNQILHEITARGNYELIIDLKDFDGNTRYAKYSSFRIGSRDEGYNLSLGSYSGTAGDSFTYNNGMKFSAQDRDLDKSPKSCATRNNVLGAWWYKVYIFEINFDMHWWIGSRDGSGVHKTRIDGNFDSNIHRIAKRLIELQKLVNNHANYKIFITACYRAHLNGPYSHKPKVLKNWMGLIWNDWRGNNYSLKESKMMIRKLS